MDPSNNVIVSPLTPVPVIVGVLSLFGVVIDAIDGADGAVVSTLKDDDVICVAAFPAASLTSAVNVYEEPSVNACNPAALTVTAALLLETDAV